MITEDEGGLSGHFSVWTERCNKDILLWNVNVVSLFCSVWSHCVPATSVLLWPNEKHTNTKIHVLTPLQMDLSMLRLSFYLFRISDFYWINCYHYYKQQKTIMTKQRNPAELKCNIEVKAEWPQTPQTCGPNPAVTSMTAVSEVCDLSKTRAVCCFI